MDKKEYIERGALLEQLNKKKAETGKMRYTEGFNDAIMRVRSMVDSASTADVAPVARGEWKLEWDAEKDPKKYFIRIVCSNCGLKTGEKSNFCPKCGAKMDGKKCVPRTEATP